MAETWNKFFVGLKGDDIVLLRPLPQVLSKEDAMNLAAWLVSLADDSGGEGFDELLKKVQTS